MFEYLNMIFCIRKIKLFMNNNNNQAHFDVRKYVSLTIEFVMSKYCALPCY